MERTKFKFESDIKYRIVYADPPWSYKDKALAGNRGAICKYPVLSMTDIKSLPVKDITADDCTLFMWITMPMLTAAQEVMEAWGFRYKTCAFTWVKRNRVSDSWFFGMGHWTRSNAELCLLGTKGRPRRISASVHSVLDDRVMRHSQKPNEARRRIVELCGDLPRIELFAREKLEGFDTWGNEIENNITLKIDERKDD